MPLADRAASLGQAHLRRFEGELDAPARAELERQIGGLDLPLIDRLVRTLVLAEPRADAGADLAAVRPPAVRRDGELAAGERREAIAAGERALRAGEVAVVLVAGGEGSRLGFDGPKGIYRIGPVSGATLFQIHAEKVLALSRRYGQPVPFLVMTGPSNHDATARFFADHADFGLDHVRLFPQGTMPAVDLDGRILLAARDRLALSPDGHGGLLTALAAPPQDGGPSCLDELAGLGVRTLFSFQVDNPLTVIADPLFVGLHLLAGGEMSTKVVEKTAPDEPVGVVVSDGDRTRLIEYSDLPADMAERREPGGRLAFAAGSIAIHLLELEFVRRLTAGGDGLPFHRALKRVAFVDANGELRQPEEPNAVKFERFVFDALPVARGPVVVLEVDRATEFEPLKNASGESSPETVRARLLDLHRGWLEAAGARIGEPDGAPVPVEISPLWALDAGEVAARLEPGTRFDRPAYLRDGGLGSDP